jgi:integrase
MTVHRVHTVTQSRWKNTVMPLTDTRIRNAKPTTKSYKLSDGGGMYLLVTPNGARYWRLDYRFAGKRRTLALGVYPEVSLASARIRREDARALIAAGADPGITKKAIKRDAKLATENTFEVVAREWLSKQRKRLAARYCALLLARLEADVFPQIGSRPVREIDAPELLDVLRKIEKRGAVETARRLRQVCGQVFRYAIATSRANRDPSVDLRGALSSPGRPRGHKAMPLSEAPRFLRALAAYDGDSRTRIALQLMVLTFTRTTELRAARWLEIENLDDEGLALWRIPAERMKMKRGHIVPLAPQAVALIRDLRALPGTDASACLFPSPSREGYMSNNTMLYAMYRMGYHGRATVHGFRAMASTALNELGFRPDVIERQLAHQEDDVRAAYNRAEYLSERREMMNFWATHLDSLGGKNVLPLGKTISRAPA